MLQRLPIELAQVKAGNISENLLNEIRQIIYSLYQAKEILKKSIQQYNFFNKVIKWNGYYIYELSLNLLDKINLKGSDKYVALSNLSICYTWTNIKSME